MVSAGPTPGTVAESIDLFAGTQQVWTNPSNALTDDANAATNSATSGSTRIFERLLVRDFGFAIPTSATILGVTARIISQRSNFASSTAKLLLRAGTSWGSDRSHSPPSSYGSYQMVGGASDLWGLALTPAIVNASTFALGVDFFGSTEPAAEGQLATCGVRYMDLTIEYSLDGISLTVSSAAQLSQSAVELDVSSAAILDTEFGRTVTSAAVLSPYLYISSPSEGAEINDATFDIEWQFSPGTQTSYRVRIYEDFDTGTNVLSGLVYDSGVVPSNNQVHTVDEAIPNPATLYAIVDITTEDSAAQSDPLSFTTSFSTPNNVENVRATAIGDCRNGGNSEFPHLEIRWSEVDPGANAFLSYSVRRREAGASSWTSVATITSAATTVFRDYEVVSGTVYEYAVVYRALTGAGVTLVSQNQSTPARGIVVFDGQWLHNTRDPRDVVHLDSFDVRTEWQQAQRLVLPWGRTAGTVHYGENLYRTGTLKPHAQLLPGVASANVAHGDGGDVWAGIEQLLDAQQNDRAVLCLRLGRERELVYCQVTRPRRTAGQKQYTAELQFVEVAGGTE